MTPTAPAAPAANPAPASNGVASPATEAAPAPPSPGATPVRPKQPQQAKPEGDSPPGEAKVPTEKTKEEELFEVIVKGEKRQYTREQALRKLARDEAADKSFIEAKELTRKNQQLIEHLKDPERVEAALEALGHDLDALSQRRLSKAVEQAQMTPEQQELAATKAELEKHKSEAKKREEAAAKAKQEADDAAAFQHFEKGFLQAAERHGVEGTPDNLLRIVEIADEALEHGYSLTEDQVMAELKEREDATFSKLEARVTKGLKGEALAKRLGPTVVGEILRWSVEKVRGGPPAPPPPAQEDEAPRTKAPQYKSPDDYLKKHGF